jgi:sugar phosphate isomerase/epimerase
MNKRLSGRTIVLAAILPLIAYLIVSCEKPAVEKQIGLQLYSLRDAMRDDVPGTIARVGAIGYTFVEAAGYRDGLFYGMAPVEFKNLCELNGLALIGSHTGRDFPEDGQWDETMAWWEQCIDAHFAAGVKWIVQPWMGRAGYESLEGLRKYCDYWNIVGEMCNAKGIRFGYHNHDREFTELEGVIIYDFMLENMDPDKVMFQLDLYWCVVGGKNPVDYFNKYPGRFEVWHIKDKTELGVSGMMDFASYWAAAPQSGLKYGVVEVEEYNFDPFESVQISFDYLKNADFVVLP